MENHLYHYRANVIYIYDGDTCTVDIDLGLDIWIRNERIRLARINAPELRGDERPQGILARDYLRELLDGKAVQLQTVKDKKGKYGRYIGELLLDQGDQQWINVSDRMVENGFAVYKNY